MRNNLNTNDNSIAKKTWQSPTLIFISQNAVTGGGPQTSAKEIAGTRYGFPHALSTPLGNRPGATPVAYNSFQHS